MRTSLHFFASRGKKPRRGEPAGDARPRVTRARRVLADRGKLIRGGLLDRYSNLATGARFASRQSRPMSTRPRSARREESVTLGYPIGTFAPLRRD